MADLAVHQYPQIPEAVEKERLEAFRLLYDCCRGQRFVHDALWGVGIAMTEGNQWILDQAYSKSSTGGRTVLRVLPERDDPGVDNVRVTLNRIKDIAEEVAALNRIDPNGWEGRFEADPRDPVASQTQLRIAKAVWRDYLDTIRLHGEAAAMNEWRTQCGSGVLKAIPDQANPYGWDIAATNLDRMIWNPADHSQEIGAHRQWADSMAWPAEEIERHYGLRFPKKENLPTLGSLRAFDHAIQAMRGATGPTTEQNRTPAVLLTEFYDDWWKRLTIIVHTGTTESQAHILWDGPNPYGACPYLKLDLGISLLSPWGIGVPIRLRADQKIYNLALTCIVRHLLTVSAVRWIYEENTVKNPRSAFSPRVGAPIGVSRNRAETPILPQMVSPPEMNNIAWQLSGMLPDIMERKVHIAPVLRGVTSSRGESGQAIGQKLAQAGRVFAATAETDNERISRFLTHHVKLLCNTAPPQLLLDAVGETLHGAVLRLAARPPLLDARIKVSLPAGAIQPETPQEKNENLKEWAALQVITPEELKWEIWRQTNRPITASQERAVSEAAEENSLFLAGATADEVEAKHFEEHDIHVPVHKEVINRRREADIPDEVVNEVGVHILRHMEQKGDERAVAFGVEAEGQGMPGATEQAAGMTMPETPLSGSMSAPQAVPAQYAARETRNRVSEPTAPVGVM